MLLLAVPAAADVAVGEGVPFTAGELDAALAPRGIELHAGTIRMVAPTTVEVTTANGRDHVELGGAHGPAAARLVALHLVDAAEIDAPPAIPPRAARRIAVASGVGRGTSAIDLTMLALRVDATWGRGPWRWGASAGWLHGLAKAEDPAQPVDANISIVRAVAGAGVGRVELVGGPALVAYTSVAAGVTWGLGGGARVRLAGTARWSAIASLDADVFGHRVVVAFDGVDFAATPRVAVTAALGIRWEAP